MSEPVYVVHEHPAGRAAPYYMAHVDLSFTGLDGQLEQLWLNDLGDNTYRVACIPFCVDGLSYLDVVQLNKDSGRVATLLRRFGHRVMRALVKPGEPGAVANLAESLTAAAERAGVAFEWHGDRFLALDVAPGSDNGDLPALLDKASKEGLLQAGFGDTNSFPPAVG